MSAHVWIIEQRSSGKWQPKLSYVFRTREDAREWAKAGLFNLDPLRIRKYVRSTK